MQTFSNKIADIRYDEELKIMRINYKGFAASNLYRQAVEKTFDIALANRCTKWLITQEEFRGVNPNDTQWLAEVWSPKIAEKFREIGINERRKTAIVKADNVFADYIAHRVADDLQTEEENKIFDKEEDALKWLLASGNE
ncbi:MAG TPA: hypothetical protein DCS93_20145 [Microscillaceae bacterium]|nr:hypothetical protein [Microscillaceae bacterium]